MSDERDAGGVKGDLRLGFPGEDFVVRCCNSKGSVGMIWSTAGKRKPVDNLG